LSPRPATPRGGAAAKTRIRVFAAILLTAAAIWLPGVAFGHAQLLSVDPADGSRVAVAPPAVTLRFDEPVGLASGGISVLDGSGRDVASGPPMLDGPEVLQPLRSLSDGWYLVTWGVVSQDGHILRAASTFAVGQSEGADPPAVGIDTAAAPFAGLSRGLADLGLLVAAGAWAAWWLLGARTRRVRRMQALATALALGGTVTWMLIEWVDGGAAWATTPAALSAASRVALLVLALVASRNRPALAAIAMGGALIGLAIGGHAVDSPLATVLEVAHLGAAAIWIGSAPAVLLILTDPDVGDAVAISVVRRFSALAVVALIVIWTAGTALALLLTNGLAGGITTRYVLILAVKLSVVGIASLTGAMARWHLRGTPSRRTLRRVFALDAALLMVVIALSSLLNLTGPHEGHADHASHGPMGSARCTTQVGQASVSIVVTPASPGKNDLRISGVPMNAIDVTVELSHQLSQGAPITLDAVEGAEDWTTQGILPLSGTWHATVVTRLDRFTETRGSCDLRIAP
jgi:copper transport protein